MRNRALLPLFVLLLTAAGLWSSATTTSAQDTKSVCDPASLIKKAAALTSKSDNKADMDTLNKLAADIEVQNIACNGMTFTGKASTLIGPFDLPTGNFKVVVTSRGAFTGRLNVLTGSCLTTTANQSSMFSITTGEASTGAEAVIKSQGCHAVIETSNVRSQWTLTIQPLEANDPSLK